MRTAHPPAPLDGFERRLRRLGSEARQAPFDSALPLRVEAEVRRRLGLPPRGGTRVLPLPLALLAAVLLALGAWWRPPVPRVGRADAAGPPASAGPALPNRSREATPARSRTSTP